MEQQRMADDLDFDFDMDDDGMFDVAGDGDILEDNKPSDKRAVVTKVVKDFGTGIKEELDTSKIISTLVDTAIPDELSETVSAIETINTGISDIYKEAVKGIKPELQKVARLSKKVIPSKFKRTRDLLDRIGGIEDPRQAKESEKELIRAKILGILPSLTEGSEAEKKLKEMVSHKKWETELQALQEISGSLKGLWRYQVEYESRYQSKSLELKYRTLFTLEKILELNKSNNETIKRQLESIVTNTALPEVLKIRKTERFAEILRDTTLQNVQEAMFGEDTWIGNLLKNVKSKVAESVNMVVQGLSAASMGLEMQAMMAEMGVQTSKERKVGGFVGGRVRNAVGNRVGDKILENEKLMKVLSLYNERVKNAPGFVRDYIARENTPEFLKTIGRGFLSLATDTSTNKKLNIAEFNPTGPAIFDNSSRISIVKVIPGYLKRILGEITSIRTGDPSVDLLDFDYSSGEFKRTTALKREIKRNIDTRVNESVAKEDINTFIKKYSKDLNLTKKEKQSFKNAIIRTIATKKYYGIEDILKTLRVNDEEELAGKLEQTLRDNEQEVIATMGLIRSYMPDIKDIVQRYIDAGMQDYVQDYISDSGYSLDMETYYSLFNNKPNAVKGSKSSKKVVEDIVTTTIDGMSKDDHERLNRLIDQAGLDTLTASGVLSGSGKSTVLVDLQKLRSFNMGISPVGQPVEENEEGQCWCADKLDKQTELLEVMNSNQENTNTILTSILDSIANMSFVSNDTVKDIEKYGFKLPSVLKAIGVGGRFIKNLAMGGLGKAKNFISKLSPMNAIKFTASSIQGVMAKLLATAGTTYKTLLGPMTALSSTLSDIFSRSLTVMTAMTTYGIKRLPDLLKIAKKGIGKVASFIVGQKDKPMDLFIDGNPEPVIRAKAMEMGLYVDITTGKIISKLSDITGPVMDIEGNMVLTTSDLRKGLKDAQGNLISLGSSIKKGLVKGIGKVISRVTGLQFKDKSKKFKGIVTDKYNQMSGKLGEVFSADAFKSILSTTIIRTEHNKDIYDELVKQTELLTKILDELDGENIRRGSWRERIKNRKKDTKKEDRKTTIKEKSSKKSMFSLDNIMELFSKASNMFGLDKMGKKVGNVVKAAGTAYAGKKALESLRKRTSGKVQDKVLKDLGSKGSLAIEKATGKTVAETAGKTVGKSLLKKIPIISIGAGLGFGIQRLLQGDITGAIGEVASGVAGTIPGIGTGISTAIDAGLAARDIALTDTGTIDVDLTPDEKEALKYIRFHNTDKDSIIKLNIAVRRLFLAMVTEYHQLTGKKIQVNSAYRSRREQSRLARRNRNAAKGLSMHSLGYAIDINSSDANALEELGLLRKYGFTRPIGGEPWHIEPAGLQVDISRAKTDPDWAMQQIINSPGKGGGGYGTVRGARKRGRSKKVAMQSMGMDRPLTKKVEMASVQPVVPQSKTTPIPKISTPTVMPAPPPISNDLLEPISTMSSTLTESLQVQKEIRDILLEYRNMKLENTKTTDTPKKPKPQKHSIPKPALDLSR